MILITCSIKEDKAFLNINLALIGSFGVWHLSGVRETQTCGLTVLSPLFATHRQHPTHSIHHRKSGRGQIQGNNISRYASQSFDTQKTLNPANSYSAHRLTPREYEAAASEPFNNHQHSFDTSLVCQFLH